MSLPGVPEVREMIPAERRALILHLLQERRAVRVSSLSEDLRVSEMTIRRDLERLENDGMLTRTHGGAVLKRYMAEEPLYVDSVGTHAEEKRRIAQAAAFSSRTATPCSSARAPPPRRCCATWIPDRGGAHHHPQSRRARGSPAAASRSSPRGRPVPATFQRRRRPACCGAGGPLSCESKTFLGIDGFDLREGLTTPTVWDLGSVDCADGRRRPAARSSVSPTSSKIGTVADAVICGLDQVDAVIVDAGVDDGVREDIRRLGLRCVAV